ncbi:MAG TPA: YhdP family protein [Candidatus Acidoferrum sp.]|nr:YhdP family protein [Candidatus Acidoferrum sp.]
MKPLTLRVIRRFKHIGLILLVAVTTYVTLGRLLMPFVATHKDTFELQLSNALGVPVTIGDIHGSWFRLGPSLTLHKLRIGDPASNNPLHTVDRIELVLDVPHSLLTHKLVVSRISATKLDFTLQEGDGGKWNLAGLPDQGGTGNADPLIDFLLNTKVLTVNEGKVALRRKGGQTLALNSVILNVQNGFIDHEAQLQLRIDDQKEPAHMVLQLDGDPRRTFSAKLWLDTEQLDLLSAVRDQLPAAWRWQQLQGHGRFWLDVDSNGIQNFAAELNDVDVVATHDDGQHKLELQHGSLKLLAQPIYMKPGQPVEWNLHVQDAGFDWDNHPWTLGKLQLTTSHVPELRFKLQADALDLAMATQVVRATVPMPEGAYEALTLLNARGLLRNMTLDTAPDGSYPNYFLLRGNLDRVAVDAWQAAPAGSGVDGYVEADAVGGFVEVDSRDMTLHLPLLFTSSWHYDRVNARVAWHAVHDEVHVQSSVIDVANEALAGKVRFDVFNTRGSDGHFNTEFSLQVGMQHMQVAQAPNYLPTLDSVADIMKWLRESLQGGELGESGFVLHTMHGNTVVPPEGSQFTGSWYRATGAVLKFRPDWPALNDAAAAVVQRDNLVDVATRGGNIGGIDVHEAEARIRPFSGTQVLGVQASADTRTGSGLDFLRNTPVHDTIGTFLDDWNGEGGISLLVALGIDLHDHAAAPLIRVETDIHNGELHMAGFDLRFSKIGGRVIFDTRSGLQAKALTANLFDKDLGIDIATTGGGTATEIIRMEGKGTAAVPQLQQWSGQPAFVRQLFNYTQGAIDYTATLTVSKTPRNPNRETSLVIASNLVGLGSKLPAPLGKKAEESMPLTLELGFGGDARTLDFRYRDFLAGSLQFDGGGIQRGLVSLGDRNRNFNVRQTDSNDAGVLINGDIDSVDVQAWQEIANAMNEAGGGGRKTEDYLRLVDVNIGKLSLLGNDFDQVNVVVRHPAHAWQINAHNDLLSGNIEVPDDKSKPLQVALDYLRLPARQVVDKSVKNPPEEPDSLQGIDPSKVRAFDFKTKELSEGPSNMGAVSFRFRPNAQGATLADFRMQSPDYSITDTTRNAGSTIDWRYADGKHQSGFTGLFAAGDLSKALPTFGQDPIVISKNASFDGALQWPGSPLHFALKHASGTMHMNINDGRYVEFSSGRLRLFGALNFDALIRRVRLDFKDIFSKGFAFDRIDGALKFNDGVVTTVTPLRIDGPSSKIAIQGEINVRDETINANAQVQIPSGQLLTTGLAVSGLWPAAVATYLASKILKVDDFTTLNYPIEGPWENPTKAGFEPPDEKSDKSGTDKNKNDSAAK